MSAAERIEAALLLLRSTYREPPPDDELMAEARSNVPPRGRWRSSIA